MRNPKVTFEFVMRHLALINRTFNAKDDYRVKSEKDSFHKLRELLRDKASNELGYKKTTDPSRIWAIIVRIYINNRLGRR